ncbi:MAG: response regulator [Flavobacteriales bacterium]|nr:response regulator [Flavobacteriales bacterium]MCB9194072.1 response regulator [Flavobacteriales bacterium]
MTVLLVDDEPDICLLLKAILERAGCACTMAHSLAEADREFTGHDFDGAVVDIDLPDGRGTAFIRKVRRQRPGMRVVAISAINGESDSAMSAGADSFLAKPLGREAILEAIGLAHGPAHSEPRS